MFDNRVLGYILYVIQFWNMALWTSTSFKEVSIRLDDGLSQLNNIKGVEHAQNMFMSFDMYLLKKW